MGDAPGILRVEPEALYVLGEVAIAGGSERSVRAWRVGRLVGGKRRVALNNCRKGGHVDWILYPERRIVGKRVERLLVGGERAAQHRFVNEVDSELKCVTARHVAQIVAHLVFVLIAQVGKKSDGSVKLIVAKSLKAGNGLGRGAERKRQRKTKVRVACLCKVQQTRIENQRANPGWAESI